MQQQQSKIEMVKQEETRGAEQKERSQQEVATISEMRRLIMAYEESRLESPFVTMSWARWQEMYVQLFQGMARVQRSIEQRAFDLAIFAGLDMQEIIAEILREASEQMAMYPATAAQARRKQR
jgi:hypothetical protein